MFPHRVDEGIGLELLELRHADELYAVTDKNREHLRRWLPWVDATTSSEVTRGFIKMTLTQVAENNGFNTAIVVEGRIAGVIGYHGINWPNRAASLGYWLAKEFEGRGIMTRCVRAYVGHAFQKLGLNRVEIRCATDNHRSCAIPERLGFTLEGTSREAEWVNDHFVDHSIYGIVAADWNANAGG